MNQRNRSSELPERCCAENHQKVTQVCFVLPQTFKILEVEIIHHSGRLKGSESWERCPVTSIGGTRIHVLYPRRTTDTEIRWCSSKLLHRWTWGITACKLDLIENRWEAGKMYIYKVHLLIIYHRKNQDYWKRPTCMTAVQLEQHVRLTVPLLLLSLLSRLSCCVVVCGGLKSDRND